MRVMVSLMLGALAAPAAAWAEPAPVKSSAPQVVASATAAKTSCQTQARNICAPAGSARLLSATGDVLLSRGAGFAEIAPGASLAAGDRLLVKNGAAKIALGGSCQAALRANSMITLVEKNGSLCAARLSADPETLAQGQGQGQGQGNGEGAGFGGVGQGTLITAGMVGLGAVAAVAITHSGGHGNRCGNSANTPAGDRCPLSK